MYMLYTMISESKYVLSARIAVSIVPQDPLEFQVRELRKYFVMGDHVRVVAGRHEGETGLLVRVEPNLAVVLTDLASHEVCQRG